MGHGDAGWDPAHEGETMSINPTPRYVLAEVAGAMGCTIISIPQHLVASYFQDPDGTAARIFGFPSVERYAEWVRERGYPRCASKTRRGRLCSMACADSCGPPQWLSLDRVGLCPTHERHGMLP